MTICRWRPWFCKANPWHRRGAGKNGIRAGIAAVTARLQTGRLKIAPTCPNLLAEAKLYRYPTADEGRSPTENPVDENNHALAALRYLISRLDARYLAKFQKKSGSDIPPEEYDPQETAEAVHGVKPYKSIDFNDPKLWHPL